MIEIKLIESDEREASINLYAECPSLDKIENRYVFFENKLYTIKIRTKELYGSLDIYVGDFCLPVNYNAKEQCYETPQMQVFDGCYDLSSISIYFTDAQERESILYSNYLRVASTKETGSQIEMMLKEIEEKLPNFLDVCFSKNQKTNGVKSKEHRSIWNTLKIIDEILLIYEQSASNFSNYKKSKVVERPNIVDIRNMKKIEQKGFQWIIQNPEYLVPVSKEVGIHIGNKNYLPLKVNAFDTEYSYDVYENQVILGFLNYLQIYIESQIAYFEMESNKAFDIPNELITRIPNTHQLTGRCIYIFYLGVIDKFKEKLELLDKLAYKYQRILECTPIIPNQIPKLSNTFKQIRHYHVCYEAMIKWFHEGEYTLDHVDYLFRLRTLSRIFEYYCLMKIERAILDNGYELYSADRINNQKNTFDDESLNNRFCFTNGKYRILLFYEPYIYRDKVCNQINLYSTGYNFSKGRWSECWTPDFVIKIEGNKREYYYILDSKYSTFSNVQKKYMPELILKYGTQIASKDNYFAETIGIGALYPNDGHRMVNFKRNDIFSIRKSFPIYFSLAIENGDSGDLWLGKRIKELLDNVDILEQDKVLTQEELERNDRNRVNGKYCLYNNKRICLINKCLCKVMDKRGICDNYRKRDEKLLRIDNVNCRNLKYYSKGMICDVTKRPGCIGQNKCAFCLKKKAKSHTK